MQMVTLVCLREVGELIYHQEPSCNEFLEGDFLGQKEYQYGCNILVANVMQV